MIDRASYSSKFDMCFFPNDNKPNHFRALDGIRGLAVICVLLSHASRKDIFLFPGLHFEGFGKIGVYLFFVLSAYLLDRQITLKLRSGEGNLKYWSEYLVKRFLRIYPLYIVALLTYWILSKFGIGTKIDNIADIAYHLILVKGEGLFWSIPVEFIYYLISPIILLGFQLLFKWKVPSITVTIILISLGTICFDYNTSLSEISTIKHLPIFFIGTLISVLEVLRKNLITDNFNKTVIDTLGILALIIIFLVFNPSTFNIFFAGHLKNSDSLLFIPIACLWGIVLLSAKYGSVVTTFFEYKPLRFVGVISFSVYLFHLIILNFVNRIPVISEIKFYVFFVLVLICASITYLFIERKISKLKIKF